MINQNILKYVNDGDVMLAIIDRIRRHNEEDTSGNYIQVLSTSQNLVTVKAGCCEVEMSWEMCCCHGGRIWLNQKETHAHIELSTPQYNTELGYDSPETELAYHIEENMIDAINKFQEYVYVVEYFYTRYANDVSHTTTSYYNDLKHASYAIFDNGDVDVLSMTGTYKYTCPNPRIRYEVEFIEYHDDAYIFESRRYEKHSEDDDFELDEHSTKRYVFRIFKKGKK